MRTLYSAGIAMYAALARVWALKDDKAAKMVEGHRKVMDYLKTNRNPRDRYIWFHAASLGEFEQGRPLIEKIRKTNPEYKILLTFFSPSGYEVRKNYAGADMICYLPFDIKSKVRAFLDIVRPEKAFFIKYEYWANYISELKKREIPVFLVSAIFRKEQVFFKWYGGFFRKLLKSYDYLFVQDEASHQMLSRIGITDVQVCGDTRFDRVLDIMHAAKDLPLVAEFVKDAPFTMVAGSSWPKDEDLILTHFNTHPEMKLIIAPHETHEAHVENIISKIHRPYLRYTQISKGDISQSELNEKLKSADCLIIDCIGLLSSIYRYGNASYIGGGFGVGIHNTLEAAVYNIPVVWGPNYQRFREALGLLDSKGGFAISSQGEYDKVVDRMIGENQFLTVSGRAAGEYVFNNAGAADKILSRVKL